MGVACIIWAMSHLAALGGSVEGVVVLDTGAPAVHADVFIEPGLGRKVLQSKTDSNGRFSFSELPPGQCGVFARAEGYGWGGVHVPLAVEQQATGIQIQLVPAVTLQGTVETAKGKPIDLAQVSRIALTGNTKVAIPLAKLKAFGVQVPTSDRDGRFSIPDVPHGETLAIKVSHGLFAQKGVRDIAWDARDLKVTMYRGVSLSGEVFSNTEQLPVANAMVQIRNAQPPHDTIVTKSNGRGVFEVRLKPGVYMYRGASGSNQSAGWKQLLIGEDAVSPSIRVVMAGTGRIKGEVRDAVSGDPVANVRIALDTFDGRAAITRTGPQGQFQFNTVMGENTVRIIEAPGFDVTALQGMTIFVNAGKTLELPGMWLKPVPVFDVTVLDANGATVANAPVQLIHPRESTPRSSNAQGALKIEPSIIPESGRVVARVSHPDRQAGALFALPRSSIGTPQKVQLLPFAAVQGTAQDVAGIPQPGVMVRSMLADGVEELPVVLWETETDSEGRFYHERVIPGVPQICVLQGGTGHGTSEPYNTAPETLKDLGVIVVSDGVAIDEAE